MSATTAGGGRESALLRFLGKAARLLATLALTLLGLLVVTFLIGRVVPVDPVLAVIGDRAPKSVYDRVYLDSASTSRFTNSSGSTSRRSPPATSAKAS